MGDAAQDAIDYGLGQLDHDDDYAPFGFVNNSARQPGPRWLQEQDLQIATVKQAHIAITQRTIALLREALRDLESIETKRSGIKIPALDRAIAGIREVAPLIEKLAMTDFKRQDRNCTAFAVLCWWCRNYNPIFVHTPSQTGAPR